VNRLPAKPGTTQDPYVRRIQRSWRFLAASFFALGVILVLRMSMDWTRPIDFIVAGLVVLVGYAAILHRNAYLAAEAGRRAEVESFARILRGLSRSVSPDAIVEAIVEDLGEATGADHIVIVRRRPESKSLDATLVSTRAGVPSSTTLFPLSDLEDPGTDVAPQRDLVAVPVTGDDPAAVDLVTAAAAPVPEEPAGQATGRSIVRTVARTGRTALDAVLGAGAPGSGWLRPELRSAGFQASAASEADLRVAEHIADRVRTVYGLRNTLAAALRTEAGLAGAIVLSRRTAEPWPPAAHRILAGAAVEASAALARAFSHRDAESRASTDALTGLPNRRYFDEFCGLLARRRRAEDAVGVLMIDIDRFKAVNDSHGHAVGDEVIRAVGQAIASAVREDDVPARFGGEEFAVLLRNPTPDMAVEVGERVREAVGRLDLRMHGVRSVTVSVGVAVGGPPNQPISELIDQADAALYRAKRGGRDRVVAASPAAAGLPTGAR
jgi:diguanylate cyclase (GGDEF)-like protein